MDATLLPELLPPDPLQDIPQRFRRVANCLPEYPAVEEAAGSLSYARLDARSDCLAAHLVRLLDVQPEPVALLLPGGALSVTAILGVLKAGKFYAPLDPLSTPEVLAKYLEVSTARLLLTLVELLPLAQSSAPPGTQILALDTLDLDQPTIPPSPRLTPDHYASLTFTSGTTAQPKAVIWHHAGWLHRCWQNRFYDHTTPDDRVGQMFSPAFIPYSTLVLTTLLNGAALVERPPGLEGLQETLDWVNQQAISMFYPPISLLRPVLVVSQHHTRIPSVRALVLGGQSLAAQDLLGLPDLVTPQCLIINRLSMSELHLVARYEVQLQDILPGCGSLPVGHACEGSEISLLDADGKPVIPGEVGQIVVRSRFLSPGYWRNPELTAARFLPDPQGGDRRILLTGDLGRMRADGNLEHCGRVDSKVKIRGFSVEPEAVETVLLAYPNVAECAVIARPGQDSEPRLLAYLASRQFPAPTASELQAHLRASLPEYMLPARFVTLERLPCNLNGKVERRLLPDPGRLRPVLAVPFAAPSTELQVQLAGLWGEILGIDEVGVDDNFFELGGDSLSALSLSLQVEALFGQALPAAYFKAPTITGLECLLQDQILADTLGKRSGISPRRGPPAIYSLRHQRKGKLGDPQKGKLGDPQKGNVYRLAVRLAGGGIRRAYRLLAAIGLGWHFYTACARSLYMLCGQEWFSRRWPQITRVHQQFLTRPEELHLALMVGLWWSVWGRQLIVLGREDFLKVCRVTGLENLQQALAVNRGVICVYSHMLFTAAFWRWLGYQDLPPGVMLLPQWKKHAGDTRPQVENVRLLVESRRALENGGLVHILPDSSNGQRPMRLPFLNTQRDFQPGFAELALLTGAEVLPVTVIFNPKGVLDITIHPAFIRGGEDHDAQVRRLLEQFAAHLAWVWKTQAPSVAGGHMARYVQELAATGTQSGDQ